MAEVQSDGRRQRDKRQHNNQPERKRGASRGMLEEVLVVGERTMRKVVSGSRALRMIAGQWERAEQAENITINH